jgi:hypothetical protein
MPVAPFTEKSVPENCSSPSTATRTLSATGLAIVR